MEQLTHNGVMVPPRYRGHGLTIEVKGQTITLNDQQEERAMAWAKKIGTPYVEDPEFAANFHKDFSEVLGTTVLPGDVDYTEIHQIVLDEREARANMTREEKKALAARRKEIREANKERYGWATIDGERTQLGNYTVEPSSIFMGRGQHPMRGKWKEGPRHEDIELNHSPPDTSYPPGIWKKVHLEPNKMWIARWKDKLSGKTKYVWPHDSSPIKQRKDIEKFDKALEFKKQIKKVKSHINDNLESEDPTRKKTATVTFLIDHCKFRVGDEKDDDEAETIGASSLKPEHIYFNGNGTVTFDFLGKDSVRHQLCVEMPAQMMDNLRQFSENSNARYKEKLREYEKALEKNIQQLDSIRQLYQESKLSEEIIKVNEKIKSKEYTITRFYNRIKKMKKIGPVLFDEVNSAQVSGFLDEVMIGLSAKVFRTHYATKAVEEGLKKMKVNSNEPDYVKKHAATMANLEAAKVCNHKRTIPRTWEQSLQRKKDRLEARILRNIESEKRIVQLVKNAEARNRERQDKYQLKLEEHQEKLKEYNEQLSEKRAQEKSTKGLEKRIASKTNVIKIQSERIKNLEVKHEERLEKLRVRLVSTKERNRIAVDKIKLQITAQAETRDYNLGTSMKSYVDPRIYYNWSRKVDYDWRKYYSKTLQSKFSWIDPEEQPAQ